MTPPTSWTTPPDIARQLEAYWQRGRLLAAPLEGTPMFPLALRLRGPDARDLAEHFDDVRKWIRTLEEGSKANVGFGYEISWSEINHRQLGRNRIPGGLQVATEIDALRLIGKIRHADQFQKLAEMTLERFPSLRDWLLRNPLMALNHAEDWQRILAVLAWVREYPRSGVYLRQVDIPRGGTKVLEARKGLFSN